MPRPIAAARDSPLLTNAAGPPGSGYRSNSQTAYPRNRATALEIRILCAVRIVTQGPSRRAGSAMVSGDFRTGPVRASTRFRITADVDPPPEARRTPKGRASREIRRVRGCGGKAEGRRRPNRHRSKGSLDPSQAEKRLGGILTISSRSWVSPGRAKNWAWKHCHRKASRWKHGPEWG
jgi:hypothetical protein